MIKTKRQRESENPPKQTRFILRGRTVDPKDITRFEKRALKKGMLKPEDELYDQGQAPRARLPLTLPLTEDRDPVEPIEDLVYDTPSPEPSHYACERARLAPVSSQVNGGTNGPGFAPSRCTTLLSVHLLTPPSRGYYDVVRGNVVPLVPRERAHDPGLAC